MEEPEKYLCPISNEVMIDPVVDALGNTYEKEEIEIWLKDHDTSPLTNEKLPNKKLTPNKDKKSEITEFKENRIKESLELLPTVIQQNKFKLAEKLLKQVDKYNKTLKNNFSKLII